MTIIRTATHDDIEAVAAMGRRFLQFAPQAKHLPLTDDQVAEILAAWPAILDAARAATDGGNA